MLAITVPDFLSATSELSEILPLFHGLDKTALTNYFHKIESMHLSTQEKKGEMKPTMLVIRV